ncbi:MAG TPA: type IV pilus twitching motility protein PilT [Gemmatimonadaceae bacterium]|nr:type IV pilus twitching motility protein PilT [Gemmatimonadaceae bacterium]
MAQLDRFLSILVSNKATALVMPEGDVATLTIKDSARPVMKQSLTSAQILTLVREIAPPDSARSLDPKSGVNFTYTSSDGSFDVSLGEIAGKLSARIEPLNGKARSNSTAGGPASNGHAPTKASPVSTAPASALPETATQTVRVNSRSLERIEDLLRALVTRNASDLHLRVGSPPMLRASGEIAPIPDTAPLSQDDIEQMLEAVMLKQNSEEFAEINDTDFAHEIAGVGRFRGNALRERKGTGAVFRAIPAAVVTVEQMGISQEVQRLCQLTKGLVLVTGPTGSGKSTTLCALIDLINRTRNDHVITIEDPIEFVHESKKCLITQRHVGVHTASFKHALRAALREDPDIVLVGELRDLETVSMAIETAETGHLVFGTVHTSSAVSTVDRVIDQFPPDRQAQIRVMLSDSLKGVISQVLCRKIGGGRVAAREIMLSTPSVSNLIREGKTFQLPSVLQTSRRLGMVTMNDALIELVDANLVEPGEAYVKATDKVGIVNMLKQRNKDVSFVETLEVATADNQAKPNGRAPTGR